MRQRALLQVLRSSAAIGAVALGSAAASAACTTANGVVTCTDASTSDQVNSAINQTPPPSVSLVVAQGATVTRGNNSSISPSGLRFPGAIGYTNSGTVGTPGANVDFTYFGNFAGAGNTFTFDNRGTQNGGIFAFNVGGAITGTNSGTVTRGLDLRGAGAISFTNTGTVFNSSPFFFGPAVNLISSRSTSETGADGITRTTETGGAVTASIGGTVGVPASGTTAFRPQNVFARSVGGVDVVITGTAGIVQAQSGGDLRASQFTSVRGATTTTTTQVNDNRTFGANARVTVSQAGQVTGVEVSSGTGTATAIIDGTVAPGANFNGSGEVNAFAFGTNSTGRQTDSFTNSSPFLTERSSNSTTVATGGAALVDISATGRVVGNVGAATNAGSATVRVAGQVGTASNFSSVRATSDQTNSTFQSRSVERADGTFEFVLNATETTSGGAALVTVAASGQVSGSLLAQGNGSATVDNAGRVSGGAGATSNRLVTTQRAENSTGTIATDAAGVRTDIVRRTTSFTEQSLGGAASVTNRLGGSIQAEVGADGVRGATVENAGSIAGGVTVRSVGTRRDGATADLTTTTSTPLAGGGRTTVVVRDTSNMQVTRATGGAATGIYSGTVGLASNSFNFSRVSQNGTTASTATVTGTLFADFAGTAGGENRDFVNSGNSRQVTQPNGSSAREESNMTRNATSQVASTSSLTLGAAGRISQAANNTGSATVTSLGGDALFTLDGGRVDGSVTVEAAAGTTVTQTASASATFTRAAAAPGTFVPEVQQSQANTSTLDERQAPGTATVAVNSGTIGGDLLAIGSGTGAGSLGANVVMNGTVTGELTALSTGANNRRETNSAFTRTAPNAVSGTSVTTTLFAPSQNGGGVLVAVGGTVGGGLLAGTDTADSTVNLTGRVGSLSPDGATVLAFDFTTRTQTTTTSAGTDFFNLRPTSSTMSSSSESSGGVATLNVVANAATRTAGTSSIEGDILVEGFGGSALNVSAGSRIVQGTGGVFVGASFRNSTSTGTATFTNGVQTGSSVTTNSTIVGGPASLNNAGVIGSSSNPTGVSVGSIGGASVVNTGTINGSVLTSARAANRSLTTTVTNGNDPARRRTVSTEVLTAAGGNAGVDNASLITGSVTAIGATGTVTNSGVIRNGVTLGGSFNNFSTTTTTTSTATPTGGFIPVTVVSPSVPNAALFTQNYTLNQNGLLLGGVNATGTTTVDPTGNTLRTSNVNATVNLNNGSITLGNINGGTDTNTNVNLNGSGFLGIAASDSTGPTAPGQVATAFLPTPSLTRFAAIDPALGTTVPLPAGSRVSGVRTMTKTGDGTFVIAGAPFLAGVGTAAPTFTLDIGTLRINGGELQLGVTPLPRTAGIGAQAVSNPAGPEFFGIRGNVENNANFVLGRRITDGTQVAIRGINISVLGNVVNSATGNLIVGVNPDFVRAGAPLAGSNPFTAAPATFVAFSPNTSLASTNSFLRVDGNLNLAGTVAVQGQSGGIYQPGRAYDLFSVSGTYTNTGAVRSSFASPFVSFTLTPRSEGGRTIVSLDVVRASFETGATDRNSLAAAGAFQATLPAVFAGLRSGSPSANVQDLANIVAALDTQLNADQAAQVFRELSSGEFYGSLSAISTTIPFGEATDGLPGPGAASGLGLWLRPTGQFATYKANQDAGASEIDLGNHGGSLGLNYSTGNGGHFGIAAGYGRIDADSDGIIEAEAETYMLGAYGVQHLGGLHLSAQAVYGRSDWTASRRLPLLGRTATSRFDSDELRGSVRAAYTIAMLPGIDFSPFARAEVRRYSFDGFTEQGAGAVSLAVAKRSKTVFSPEVGARMSGSLGGRIRPFAEASYIFQGDVGSDRRTSFVGGTGEFTLKGVDPTDSIKGAVGVAADVGSGTIFVRGDYHSGGQQQVGSVRGGLIFTF